jgi:cell division septal protein FtsQ
LTATDTTEPAEQVDIDPRIVARRVSVQRAHARRRGRVMVLVAAVVVVLIGSYVVLNSALLDIDHVDVYGARHITAAQVRAAAGVHTGRPLYRVDLATGARKPGHVVAITGITRIPTLHRSLAPAGLAAVVRAIPPALAPRVRELAVARSSLTLVLDGGAQVRLGNTSAPAAKFAAATAVMATLHGRPFQYIDVSDPADPVARM